MICGHAIVNVYYGYPNLAAQALFGYQVYMISYRYTCLRIKYTCEDEQIYKFSIQISSSG